MPTPSASASAILARPLGLSMTEASWTLRMLPHSIIAAGLCARLSVPRSLRTARPRCPAYVERVNPAATMASRSWRASRARPRPGLVGVAIKPSGGDDVEALVACRGAIGVDRDQQVRVIPQGKSAPCIDAGSPAVVTSSGEDHPGPTCAQQGRKPSRDIPVEGRLEIARAGFRTNRVALLLEAPSVDQTRDLSDVPAISTVVTWVDHDHTTVQLQRRPGGYSGTRPRRRGGR